MTKTRIFVSWRKEEAWLTGMGKRGYKLTEIDAFDYKFVRHEGAVYEYSLEWLDVSPESDTGEEYLSSLSAGGWELCAAKRGWAYLVRRTDSESVSGEPVHTDAAVRRTAKHYRGVALFCLILFLVFVGISAYNFRYVAFFDAEEYTVPAISTDSDFLSGVFNNLIAGKNPASALLVLLLPIDAVLLLLCALDQLFLSGKIALTWLFPYAQAHLLPRLHAHAALLQREDTDEGIRMRGYLDPAWRTLFRAYENADEAQR